MSTSDKRKWFFPVVFIRLHKNSFRYLVILPKVYIQLKIAAGPVPDAELPRVSLFIPACSPRH